jgi:hypothetical protein
VANKTFQSVSWFGLCPDSLNNFSLATQKGSFVRGWKGVVLAEVVAVSGGDVVASAAVEVVRAISSGPTEVVDPDLDPLPQAASTDRQPMKSTVLRILRYTAIPFNGTR